MYTVERVALINLRLNIIMSISNTGLYLDDEKDISLNMRVIVRPMVLFSILDHFMRRQKDQKRVIGTQRTKAPFPKSSRSLKHQTPNTKHQVLFWEKSQIMLRKLQIVIPSIIPNRKNVLSIRKFRTNSTRYIEEPTKRNKS